MVCASPSARSKSSQRWLNRAHHSRRSSFWTCAIVRRFRRRSACSGGSIRRPGVVIVAAALEPALMLEAMRAGVTEFLTAPVTATELTRCCRASHDGAARRRRAERCSRSSAPRAAWARRRSPSTSRPTLAQTASGSTLLIDLHLAYGDAAVYLGTEPRFSVIDALENVHRLDKAFLSGLVGHARAGLSLLASSDRASATPVDSDERANADRVCRAALPLRRARRAAHRT